MSNASGPCTRIKVGEHDVRVYPSPSKKGSREYPGFVADLRPFGLKPKWRSTLAALEGVVRELVGPLVGECETLTLRRGQLRAYERAIKIAGELGLELDEALQRLRGIQQLATAKGCTPERGIEYWARHHDQSKFNTPTPELVDLFLRDLGGNSEEDIAGAKGKLKAFARTFRCPPRDVTIEQLEAYFASLTGSPRHRLNHRNEIRRFFNWIAQKGYLPPDYPGIPLFVGKVRVKKKRVEVYDRVQRDKLIAQARPKERAITMLKAYVPIRAKEAGCACWEDFDWEVGVLMVWADKAKTGEPRPLYMPLELCARLRPLAKTDGRIYPFKSYYKVGPRLARKANLKWIRNGLRKTVISHLQAAVDNRERVAEEAGTSVKKLKSNYLKPLRPDVGRAYFGLKKGERHPIEPGYNAEHYGTDIPAEPTEETGNVIAVQFGGQR